VPASLLPTPSLPPTPGVAAGGTAQQQQQQQQRVQWAALGVLEYALRLCLVEAAEGAPHWEVADERMRMAFQAASAGGPRPVAAPPPGSRAAAGASGGRRRGGRSPSGSLAAGMEARFGGLELEPAAESGGGRRAWRRGFGSPV
jgi:hypothetical protein